MSAGFSRRKQIGEWNPELRIWTVPAVQASFFELLAPYSATWPTSGSMRNGQAFALRRSALHTSASASSSSLTGATPLPTPRARDWKGDGFEDGLPNVAKLLKTPTAQLAVNGGSQHPDKRKSGGHGPTLADEVEKGLPGSPGSLLPTPKATDSESTANFRPDGTAYSSGYGMTLTDAARLLPTPKATDGSKGGPNQRGSSGDLTLPSAAVRLLPTPRATDTGTPGRRSSEGFRPPLSEVVLPLLPTPTATQYGTNRSDSEGAAVRPSLPTLAPALVEADTDPSASTFTRGRPTSRGASTRQRSGGGKRSSGGTPPGQLMIEVA